MAVQVRLHIGPPKTATTTIQRVLAGQREALAQRGVLYPEPENHSDVFFPQLARWTPDGPRWTVMPTRGARRHAMTWPRFLKAVDDHPGPVIVSSEVLSALPAEGVAAFLSTLPVPPTVVLVQRPVSRQIPSWHQEAVKRWQTPDFEAHARAMLDSLFDPGRTDFDFLNAGKLERRWRAGGVDVTVVSACPDLSVEALAEVLACLAPELENLEFGVPANVSMSGFGVRLWGEHVADSPPRLAAQGLAVLSHMLATFPETADPALGGHLALQAEVGELADAYVAGSPAAGRDLRRHLDRGDCVTQPIADGDADEIRAALRRWQRQEAVKWQVLAVGSRLSCRGRLTPGMWR